MTRDEAIAELERRRSSRPDVTWIATRRDGEWVVASIGVDPRPTEPTGTAVQPPPPAPREDPQSELQRVSTQFGSAG
jgi:hypothetical protein